MAKVLENLVDKARGEVKTFGELEEGQGVRNYQFGDGFDAGVFGNPDNYTPDSPNGWQLNLYPENANNGFIQRLQQNIERNKQ